MYKNVIKQTCHLVCLMYSSGTVWSKNEYIKKAWMEMLSDVLE